MRATAGAAGCGSTSMVQRKSRVTAAERPPWWPVGPRRGGPPPDGRVRPSCIWELWHSSWVAEVPLCLTFLEEQIKICFKSWGSKAF